MSQVFRACDILFNLEQRDRGPRKWVQHVYGTDGWNRMRHIPPERTGRRAGLCASRVAVVMKVAAIIPAYNEAVTIDGVVQVALGCDCVDEVIVVDSVSTDETAAVASEAGARVVSAATSGKGEAMSAGVAETDADVLLFLDGDLLGLREEHLDRLVGAIEAGADMSCGLFDRGPWFNPLFLRVLPILTGERAVRRELFESLDERDTHGYKIEAALNSRCAEVGGKREAFICPGLWHMTKEKKYRYPVQGFVIKSAMLATAAWEYLSYQVRRRSYKRAGAGAGS